MADRWEKLLELSWRERWLLVRVYMAFVFVSLTLRLIGLRRCQTVLTRLSPVDEQISFSEAQDRRHNLSTLAKMVDVVSCSGPLRAGCLEKSLTLWWLLRRRGIKGDLRIGVRKEEDNLTAHAWVESDGTVLNDSGDVRARFAAFDSPILPSGINFK